jgi:transposase
MDAREQRGLIIAATCKLKQSTDGTWVVPSQSNTDKLYTVDLNKKTCNCPDYVENSESSKNPFICKHVYAASYTHKRDYLPDGTMIETKTITLTKKTTYKQDWRAYNLAQTTEKHRFQELLFDLTRGVKETYIPGGRGRAPHSNKDSLFAMGLKVYTTLSCRRGQCDMMDACESKYMSKPITGQKLSEIMDRPHFTPILKELIGYSARPLRGVESTFAIDSSGFSANKFERYYDHKWGATRFKHAWIKVHLACGTKTNIVTAVRILDKDAADSPQFVPLVRETKRHFTIGEVSADKAYGSLENFEEVADCGGQAYIAFKSNTTGGVGGQFEKAFHYFQFKQEEYLQHYHKRSNVESTFSAIKRKFGDNVRSKTENAMVNEALVKILCHNICCLIQEQCELGIEPIFWKEEEREAIEESGYLKLSRA